jgi:hypothetical protein
MLENTGFTEKYQKKFRNRLPNGVYGVSLYVGGVKL